jgi:hypothetical protein
MPSLRLLATGPLLLACCAVACGGSGSNGGDASSSGGDASLGDARVDGSGEASVDASADGSSEQDALAAGEGGDASGIGDGSVPGDGGDASGIDDASVPGDGGDASAVSDASVAGDGGDGGASGDACTPDPCVHSMTGCTPTGATGYTCGTCVAGWTGANCDMPVTCSGATAPANGAVTASSATFGNTVTYSCNGGYTLAGTATATCQANGTFTGPAPTCTPSSCGTYTDVVYHATGTFAIADTPLGAGNQTFTGLGTNASTPAFTGAGDTTPFSVPAPAGGASFTNGMVRLRFTNDATGNPAPGTVSLVEWYFPLEFIQTAGATMHDNVDHSVGLLAAGLSDCGGGDSACASNAPTLSRPCAANATGALAGTTLTWGACTVPTMMTSWSFVSARAATGTGCATGYNAWGNTTCNTGCGFVSPAGVGDYYQTWNQELQKLTFSSTAYQTATFTMPAIQIPNGTGQSVTTLAITSTTVVATRCGSTPGTDLVCDVQ